MKKKIILEFEKELNPKYKEWTKEAAEKFISFFPEFKDNFEVETNFNSINQTLDAASTNGLVDLREWLKLKENNRTYALADEPLRISIAARATTFAYGISNQMVGPCISAAACAALPVSSKEEYFKNIVMHELGHSFDATHENRDNVVENLGAHCTDADCLMYEYAYTKNSFEKRQQIGADNPFCDDCMDSMRDFMENTLKMINSQSQTQSLNSIDIRSLPFFKEATPSLLAALDNYELILREENISRTPKEKLLDMMQIYSSALSGQRQMPSSRGDVIGEDRFLRGVAKTDWSDASSYTILQGKLYSLRRYVTYTAPFDFDKDTDTPQIEAIDQAQMAQGSLARVKDEGYWIRKYGQGYFDNIKNDPQKEVHRFILNVNPTPELFKQLDDFSIKYGCQYKFPHLMSWHTRIDPIVIYTSDDRVNEQIKELIGIASPNVRTELLTNGLDGTRLADGIFMAKERDKNDILALAKLAEQNLPEVAQKLREEAQDSRIHPLSLGEFLAYEELILNINEGAKEGYNYKTPEIDFLKPDIRSLQAMYMTLQKHNPSLAQELSDLVDDFEQKNGKEDYAPILSDFKYQLLKIEYDRLPANPPKALTYIDDVNLAEMDFLKSYDNYLEKNNIPREEKNVFLDKMSLLAQMRRDYNYSNQHSDQYTILGKYDFERTAKEKWNRAISFSALKTTLYEAKKNVKYDTELFDGTRPATRNSDGTIPPYAVGGHTAKGDEFAKILIDDKDMEIKANLLSESWVYRMPPNRGNDDFVKKPIVERFAINALPDKDLINKLDAFAKKYKVYYKTAVPTKWHKRNDPVVIYCSQPQTAAMTNELKMIVGPYIRKSKPDRMNDLDGTLIADGLVSAKEPDKNSLKALFDEIQAINPEMAQALKNDIAEQSKYNPNNPLSLGQMEAYRLMLNSYKNFIERDGFDDVRISNEKLEEINNSNNRSFKKAYREIFEPAARKEGSQYVENIRAKNYEAQIKKADGSVDYVEANSATNVSLSSKDKDGKVKVPGMERFENIVAYAKKKNARVAFGDIKTPEFKARLMIACLEAEPVAKMNGQPNLDKEFLGQIEPETKSRLLAAIKKTQPQKQQDDTGNNPPIPTPASQNNYEKSRETRIKFLEAKEKLGKITEAEKAELDFAKEMIKVTKESAAAEARLRINPRDVEHQQNSGLAPENYYYSTKTNHNCAAWKLHLDIVPNRNDPTTKMISEYLEALDIEHKIYHGGENGKGMTIYVGNYEDTKKLSKEINSRFGKDIEKSPCYVDQALSEHYFNDKVSGRFYLQGIFSTQYPRGSVAGICPSRYGSASDCGSECFIFAMLQKEGLISTGDSAGKYFNGFGTEDFHKHYEFHNIETYCAHKLYQKEMGEFYCGSDADKYEKEMFGDKLPQAGTPERTKLDEIAKKYMTFMEKQNPQLIQKMKSLAMGYAPIDFSKAPKRVQPQPTKQGGRP